MHAGLDPNARSARERQRDPGSGAGVTVQWTRAPPPSARCSRRRRRRA